MRRGFALVTLAALAALAAPGSVSAKFLFEGGVAAGDVTSRTALLWTRTNTAVRLTAEVATDRRFRDVVDMANARATVARDFTVEVEVRGLEPGEGYYYRFVGPGGTRSPVGYFRTPPRGDDLTVRFVYSGDSDGTVTSGATPNYRDEIAASAGSIRRQGADIFIYLGDTIYSDTSLLPKEQHADTLDEYRAKYREVRTIAALRRLLASTSVVAHWDDHEVKGDYAGNPPTPFAVGGLTAEQMAAGQQAFREHFPIDEGPGDATYRRLPWGEDLELFVLDERSYRMSPQAALAACFQPETAEPDVAPTLPQPVRSSFAGNTGLDYLSQPPPPGCLEAINDPARTMLGAAQEAWLKEALAKSKATFKVIVNEVPIQELYAAPYDRWEGYAAERRELLTFIRDSHITGVFFATTDTHATIANVVCVTTLAPDGTYACQPEGAPWEMVAGPIGTENFASEVNDVVPGAAPLIEGFIKSFLHSPCIDINEPAAFAVATVNGRKDTLTVVPKRPGGARGEPLCAPIVIKG